MNNKQLDDIVIGLGDCITNPDNETAHMKADELLCEALTMLGQNEIVELYKKIEKWYS